MIILTDIHGNFDTMLALLELIPQEEKDKGIVICGDLIDRGPKSKEVVQYIIDNNILCVKGNHEEMMVDWVANGSSYNDMLWLGNGGMECLDSYKLKDEDEFLKGDVDKSKLQDHAIFMNSLPYYIEFPDIKNKEGRYLVISHSNIGNVWSSKDKIQSRQEITWGRPHTVKDIPEIFNVIGHTPQKNGPSIQTSYANIDTGCFYTEQGYGVLTALQFPEMIRYEHENIDMKRGKNE